MATVTVCIAARNEADNIRLLVQDVLRMGYRVIVVDDASTDGTAQAAGVHERLTVMSNSERQGIAQSYLRAWREAIKHGTDYIVDMDAGKSHLPPTIPQMISLLENGYDIVLGTRFLPKSRYVGNARRRMMSKVATMMCNFAIPKAHYSDWTSGFRAFRAKEIKLLLAKPYYAKMHAWQIEVLARAHALRARIAETPITYVAGRSSFNWRAAEEAFGIWLGLLFG